MDFAETNEQEINIRCMSEDIFNTIEGKKWTNSELGIKDIINDLESLRKEFIKYYAIHLQK